MTWLFPCQPVNVEYCRPFPRRHANAKTALRLIAVAQLPLTDSGRCTMLRKASRNLESGINSWMQL